MNNYNYFNEEWYKNIPNNLYSIRNIDSNPSLTTPTEGYIRGNLFTNLYDQYKNYQPARLIPKNEKEEMLLNLNQMQFAMHEMNLYLDVFPNDSNAMNQFIMFRNSYNELLDNFQRKYGAININSEFLNNAPFGWAMESWPWDWRNL